MGDPCNPHGKWKMLDIRGHLLFGPMYIKCPEQVFFDLQDKLVVPRGRRRVDRE